MFTKLADSRAISTIKRLRYLLAAILLVTAIAIVIVKIPISRGATPASGSVSESNNKVTWVGQIKPLPDLQTAARLTIPAATTLA